MGVSFLSSVVNILSIDILFLPVFTFETLHQQYVLTNLQRETGLCIGYSDLAIGWITEESWNDFQLG